MRVARERGDVGYTLVELLVSAALIISLTAVTCWLLKDARTAIEVSSQRAELQQRARVGLEAITSAIRDAGAGPDDGPFAGSVIRWAPAVWPGRADRSPTPDAITVLRVMPSVSSATLARDASADAATLEFDWAGCALPCGFVDRMIVAVLDGRGDFDLFVLLDTDGASASVRRLSGGTGSSYVRGAAVLPADMRTYYWNASGQELRADAGDRADFPVVNDVVGISFEYLGDPEPPQEPRPPAGDENCLYQASGAVRPGLQTLPRAGGTLAPLGRALFQDGPWCGVGSDPFDADLLRIRAVRVALRLQTASRSHRGVSAEWFRNPGSGVDSALLVKDLTIQTTITPRNLGRWR